MVGMGFVGFVLLLETFEAARPSCWKRVCQAPKIPLGITTAVIFKHPFPRVSGGGMVGSQFPEFSLWEGL